MNQPSLLLTIQSAAQLAATGNYQAATSLLNTIPESEASLKDYLLRAKIYAQQGLYPQAIEQWEKALSRDTVNQEALAGIRKAEHFKSHSANKVFRRKRILYIFFLLLMVGLVGIFSIIAGRISPDGSTNVSEVTKEILNIQDQQSLKIQKIDEKLSSLIAISENPPNIGIKIPGILQTTENNTVILTFENGLFYSGTNRLKSEELSRLSSLAQELETHVRNVSLRVAGHTDNIPLSERSAYPDNESLGFARAVAVIEQLRSGAHLPSSIFSAISAGESSPPYPNDTHENRERNRTVVIRISGRDI